MPAVIHAHPYLLLPLTHCEIHPTVAQRLVLPPTCILRAVTYYYTTGKLSLPGEYNIWNMALPVHRYDLPFYDAFRVSLHTANAADRPTPGHI
jgi:hypothetical protein